MSTCPVCNKDLVVVGDIHEDGMERCPDNHYTFTHSYGSYHTVISDGTDYTKMETCHGYNEGENTARAREEAEAVFALYLKIRSNLKGTLDLNIKGTLDFVPSEEESRLGEEIKTEFDEFMKRNGSKSSVIPIT